MGPEEKALADLGNSNAWIDAMKRTSSHCLHCRCCSILDIMAINLSELTCLPWISMSCCAIHRRCFVVVVFLSLRMKDRKIQTNARGEVARMLLPTSKSRRQEQSYRLQHISVTYKLVRDSYAFLTCFTSAATNCKQSPTDLCLFAMSLTTRCQISPWFGSAFSQRSLTAFCCSSVPFSSSKA